jgi:hypothetical protein
VQVKSAGKEYAKADDGDKKTGEEFGLDLRRSGDVHTLTRNEVRSGKAGNHEVLRQESSSTGKPVSRQ